MGNACIAPAEEPRVVTAVPRWRAHGAVQKPACVKRLLVDEDDSNTLYAGSWDALARRYDLRTGELTLVYTGAMADIIDMAQCTTVDGQRLLFAAPCGPPGICCWRRGDAQLVCVFVTDPAHASPNGAFSAYGLAATPTRLYCGHAFRGVMSWPVAGALPRDDGQAAIVAHPKLFTASGPLDSERGPATLVSSNGAMALALSPSGSPGPRLLATGHIVELNVLLTIPGSQAAALPAATLDEAADANSRQHSGEFGLFVWDAEAGTARALLGFKHNAALRAVEWAGADSLISGDLNGRVLHWRVSTREVLRQLAPCSQARCRVLLLVSPGALPWPAGGRDQRAAAATRVLTGSDDGPPLVAHALVPSGARAPRGGGGAAAADGTPPPLVMLSAATLPAAGRNSLYSVAQTHDFFVTGHKAGEIFVWSRESGNLLKAMGTAGSANDAPFVRGAAPAHDPSTLAVVMPGAANSSQGTHLARELNVYRPLKF